MAHKVVVLGLALLLSACGGRFETADPAGGTTGGGGTVGGSGGTGVGGGSGATGGSIGVGGWVATGGSVGAGGSIGIGGSVGAGGVDLRACSSPTDCALEPVNCCPSSCEPVPLSQYTAVNNKYVAQYTERCAAVDCAIPPCVWTPIEQHNLPYFAATCRSGQCEAIDVRTLGMADCDTSADCYLRMGTHCCETCGSSMDQVVALSRKVDAWPTLCGSGPIGCPACMPVMPSGLSPFCSSAKKCVVVQTAQDAGAATPY